MATKALAELIPATENAAPYLAVTRLRRIARKAVEESDRARALYLERFYEVGKEMPTHYDVTVNTETMTIASAARLVMQAALTL